MLVTMKEILDHAKKGGYGVTAPNVQSEDTVRAVLEVAEEYHAPMIVDVNAFIHTDLPCRKGVSTCRNQSGSWKIL